MQVIRFFEKMRVSYLSALSDPKSYRKKWVAEIKSLREQWDDIDDFAKALKDTIDEKQLFSNEANDMKVIPLERFMKILKS